MGNVEKLEEAIEFVAKFTGFHRFAEFTADDVRTRESGLNSMVLASNNEMVLLPMNEPVFGKLFFDITESISSTSHTSEGHWKLFPGHIICLNKLLDCLSKDKFTFSIM